MYLMYTVYYECMYLYPLIYRTTAVIDYTSSSVGNSNKRPLNVSLSSDAKKTKLTPRPNRCHTIQLLYYCTASVTY